MRKGLLLTLLTLVSSYLSAQDCTELGQNPGTAFPICGVQVFSQSEVKICGTRSLPGPCSAEGITDKNPYWYKFTCFKSGTLGFTITPLVIEDDYDWQLFDITGEDPMKVYTDRTLFVACNWSGEGGETGASSAGTSLQICSGLGKPLWSAMPNIIEGHEYLLLISHFTDSQSGYELEFGGGTGEITDTRIPQMSLAFGGCSGDRVSIKLNKRLRCNSLTSAGTEFYFPNGEAVVTGAFSPTCSNGFDMDSIVLQLDRILPAGASYQLAVHNGSDANTLLDPCGLAMPTSSISFEVPYDVSANFLMQVREGCKTDTIIVVHDGANNTNYWKWEANGRAASALRQSSILFSEAGEKTISLIVSNGFCSDTSAQTLTVQPKLLAAFDGPEMQCVRDLVVFTDKSTGPIERWEWDLGEARSSTLPNPDPFLYNAPMMEQTYRVGLKIFAANGCEDSTFRNVLIMRNCFITVPNAFTPNSDGKNDFLYPSNAFNAENLVFRVFNRYGQKVFESRDWRNKWDGTLNGKAQATGTYVWTLSYVLKTTKRQFVQRGTTVLLR